MAMFGVGVEVSDALLECDVQGPRRRTDDETVLISPSGLEFLVCLAHQGMRSPKALGDYDSRSLLPLVRKWLAPEDDSFFGQIGTAIGDSVSDQLGRAALDLTSVSWGVAPLLGGLLLVSYAAWRTLR